MNVKKLNTSTRGGDIDNDPWGWKKQFIYVEALSQREMNGFGDIIDKHYV